MGDNRLLNHDRAISYNIPDTGLGKRGVRTGHFKINFPNSRVHVRFISTSSLLDTDLKIDLFEGKKR